MSDVRSGATRLFLPTLEMAGEPRGKFLDAVRTAASGEFEILGELGRRDDGGIAYLARDLLQPRLVALRLERTPGSRHDYVLNVLEELDGTLPASGTGCLACSQPLRGWGRFCPNCGYDLSGLDASGLSASGAKVEDLVGEVAGAGCKVLGEMSRAEGGGTVFFAKQEGQNTIVGFRLRQGEGADYSVDRTTEITFLPDAFQREGSSESSNEAEGFPPSHMAPTVHADATDASTSVEVRDAQDIPSRSSHSTSRLLVILIVVAALTIGIALGVLFGS